MKKIQLFLVIIIFFAGAALRVIDLGKIPSGLTNDEANTGYDAYSIFKTGRDQWGNIQPSTYLKGFGDYRTPIYTYMAIPSVAFFGLNEFAVRLPAAVAGSATVLLVYFLSMILWKNRIIAIISMAFLAFNPWHVAMSRIGIESTLAVFIFTLALLLFFLGLTSKRWLYPAMILFGLCVYTYTSYVILAPLFVCALFIINRKKIFSDKRTAFACIFLFIFVISALFLGGNIKTASVRSGQVNLTSDIGIINVVNDKRGECQANFQNKICQLFQNKYVAFAQTFVGNYISHFSPELLANDGTTTQYSVLPQRGLLYKTEYIFLLIGLVFLLMKKRPGQLFILLWLFLSPLPDSLTGNGHYSRFMPILPALQLVAALGFYETWSFLKKKRWILIPVVPILAFEIISFFIVYFSYFSKFYATFSQYGYRSLVTYITTNEKDYSKIIISSRVNDTKQYVYYLFYTAYDPALYQSGKNVEKIVESGGWIRVLRLGKIYFLPGLSLTPDDLKLPTKNILLAGAPGEFPKKIKIKQKIKDPKGNTIFLLADLKDNPILNQ